MTIFRAAPGIFLDITLGTPEIFLSYILPVHNEEQILEQSVNQLVQRLSNYEKAEILLVENGSRDRSWEIALKLAKNTPGQVCVKSFQEVQKGLGFALHRGMLEALNSPSENFPPQRHWLIMSAADLPFDMTDLEGFDNHVRSQNNRLMMLGSKAHPRSVIDYPRMRKAMSWGYRLMRRIFLGMKTQDSQGSVFLRADLAAQIYPLIQSRDFFYSTELVYFSEKKGFIPLELPVTLKLQKRPSTVRPFQDGLKMLRQIFKLRRRKV